MLAVLAAMVSCNKSGLDISSGNVVGEMNVTAAAGRFTVSVETVGRWIVYEADNADWVEFDVKGGVGKGAFTVSYGSNMSSVVDLRSARKARIVVTSEDFSKSDTLNVIQQGPLAIHDLIACLTGSEDGSLPEQVRLIHGHGAPLDMELGQ